LINMCQLAAYVGDREIASLLLNSLEYQEPYLGAHATGIGVINGNRISVVKAPGYVEHVKEITKIAELDGKCAIAHSRYNNNAKVDPRYNTAEMAHPFLSEDSKFALMHNGGITNYKEHWARLRENHKFSSYSSEVDDITDSEVAIHDLSDAVSEGKTIGDSLKSISKTYTGSFLLCAISVKEPETIYIANWHQPCYIAIGDNETMFASSYAGLRDVQEDMSSIFQPPKNSLIKLTRKGVEISMMDPGRKVPRLQLDHNLLGDSVIDILRENGRRDFRELRDDLNPDGWAEAYGISNREWGALRRDGVSIVNPFIDVIEMLKRDELILESIDTRLEGGIEGTPRFSYVLS
jgi:glucosamine 6-phosphate synthetase-like amidotransferase/phosphosugar isomerase protein